MAVNGETKVATIIMKKARTLDRPAVDAGFEDTDFSVATFTQTRAFAEDDG